MRRVTEQDHILLSKHFKYYNISWETLQEREYIVHEFEKCTCYLQERGSQLHITYILSLEPRKGYAKKLINQLIQECKGEILTCYTEETNMASRELWKSCNFKELDFNLNYSNGTKKLIYVHI